MATPGLSSTARQVAWARSRSSGWMKSSGRHPSQWSAGKPMAPTLVAVEYRMIPSASRSDTMSRALVRSLRNRRPETSSSSRARWRSVRSTICTSTSDRPRRSPARSRTTASIETWDVRPSASTIDTCTPAEDPPWASVRSRSSTSGWSSGSTKLRSGRPMASSAEQPTRLQNARLTRRSTSSSASPVAMADWSTSGPQAQISVSASPKVSDMPVPLSSPVANWPR